MRLTKNNLKHIPFLLGSLFLLLWPAFYNGYPLFYADSGTYISSAIHLDVPIDRPLFYGFFLRITTMQAHMWWPLILQGIITFWVINRTIIQLFPTIKTFTKGIILIALTGLTGLPWYTAQIMPDLFTALSILVLFLIYADQTAKKSTRITYYLLLFFMIGTHYSNLLICGLTVSFILLISIKKIWTNQTGYRWSTVWIFVTLLAVSFTHSLITYTQYGLFQMSRGSNLFIAAKCLETPLLKTYMRENKNNISIPFSDRIDSIPNSACGFLWGAESPLNQLGVNRVQTNQVYGTVLKDLFSQTTYRNWFITESFSSTGKQLLLHKIGSGLVPYNRPGGPYSMIKYHYESEFHDFRYSKQQLVGLEDNYHKYISGIILLISCALVLFGLIFRFLRDKLGLFIGIVLVGVLANAFITASLANVYDRLQVRVVWLISFAAILIVIETVQFLRQKSNKIE